MQLAHDHEAIDVMRQQVHQRPDDAEARLAFINRLVAAHNDNKDEDAIAEAIRAFTPLHPLLDALPELYLVKAALEHAAGLTAELQDSLEILLEQRPEDSNLLRSYAENLMAQQKWHDALPIILRYRKVQPDNAAGLDFLVATLLELGRENEAVSITDGVLRQQPGLDFRRSVNFIAGQDNARAQGLPPILISTQFKSGTNFISDGLCNGLGLPHCWITLPGLAHRIVPRQLEVLASGGALCQQHLPALQEIVEEIRDSGIDRFINHVRDPRQSMLSAVHYLGKEYERTDFVGARIRARYPAAYAEWSFAQRLDHYISGAFVGEAQRTGAWFALCANPPAGIRIHLTTFEAMKSDSRRFFDDILGFYEIPQSKFDWSQVNLHPKPGDLHYRKGATDEWKSVLTPQQQSDCAQIMSEAGVEHYL